MAKLKTVYICSALQEEVSSASSKSSVKKKISSTKIVNFKDIEVEENFRYNTKFNEFDRVLGGGLVKGAVVLLTGNPGIGKSTLLLQAVDEYSKYGEVLYISGEESPSQVKYRGERLGLSGNNISIMSETEMESIYDYVIKKKPKVVVVDSIQTLYSSNFDSIPGTTTQIRECTLKIVELAKTHDISFFLVGHITKDGKVAGPKLLEHMVDSVLQFEGEEGLFYRILRSLKNRFGSTNELGIFNMEEKGMVEVKNPSEFFLSERDEKNIGSIVVPVLEGTKIFLLEIQTLVNESPLYRVIRFLLSEIAITKLFVCLATLCAVLCLVPLSLVLNFFSGCKCTLAYLIFPAVPSKIIAPSIFDSS